MGLGLNITGLNQGDGLSRRFVGGKKRMALRSGRLGQSPKVLVETYFPVKQSVVELAGEEGDASKKPFFVPD